MKNIRIQFKIKRTKKLVFAFYIINPMINSMKSPNLVFNQMIKCKVHI